MQHQPLALIINDNDQKPWICDYYNLFTKKLRKYGFELTANKRHFEEREGGINAGSKLHKAKNKPLFWRKRVSEHALGRRQNLA